MILEIEILAVATPFFVLMWSMHSKLATLTTVISICPNCPKVKE